MSLPADPGTDDRHLVGRKLGKFRITAVPTALALILAGCAPANRVRSYCQSHPLTTGDEWSCVVTGPIVDSAVTNIYSTESRNRVAHVNIALQVKKGTLRLTYYDVSGEQHMLVTPAMPVNLTMKTPMRNRAFSVFYEPLNGAVEGVAGTVKYSTP